jgi:soluble lytic murein transglycosylase
MKPRFTALPDWVLRFRQHCRDGSTAKHLSMSNPSPIIAACLWSALAFGQSDSLLQAVRVHSPAAAAIAFEELKQCRSLPKPCPTLRSLSLLNGVLLLAKGEAKEALAQLRSVPPPPQLKAFHAWYLGEAFAYAGDLKSALRTIKQGTLGSPPWLEKRMRLRVAELQLEQGQARAALAVFDSALKEKRTPELLYNRALARLRTKNEDGARSDAVTLAIHFPTHPHATLATRLLDRTGAYSFSIAEHFTRTEAFLAASRLKDALKEVSDLEGKYQLDAALLSKAALLKAQALLLSGKDADAEPALELAAKGSREVAAEALLFKARRQMRLGLNEQARTTFESLAQTYPLDRNADEAGYFAAWLSMTLREDEKALAAFAAFEKANPYSRRRDEARWFQGYALYRLGRFDEARRRLLGLVEDFPKSPLVAQARYWSTRALEGAERAVDGGTPDAGQVSAMQIVAEYEALRSSAPLSFYAVLGRERLRARGVASRNWLPSISREMPATPTPKALTLFELLSANGLMVDAEASLDEVLGQVKNDADASAFAQALTRRHDYGNAYALANRHLWPALTAQNPTALNLFYPKAFGESVEAQSADSKVDPFFAWAIMRRESAFKSDVVSAADARGLMQIIPPTMREIALRLKMNAQELSPDDLYSPQINIRFGTWYLGALLERFHHPSLSAAGYNAGPSAVARWMTQRGQLELDAFVEEIPFKETRGYVKQVTADLALYHQLDGDTDFVVPLTLPVPGEGVQF